MTPRGMFPELSVILKGETELIKLGYSCELNDSISHIESLTGGDQWGSHKAYTPGSVAKRSSG
jgi:hypothetical protein